MLPYLCVVDYVIISRFYHADTDSIRLSPLLWQEVRVFPSYGILPPLHHHANSTWNRLHQRLYRTGHQYNRHKGNTNKVITNSQPPWQWIVLRLYIGSISGRYLGGHLRKALLALAYALPHTTISSSTNCFARLISRHYSPLETAFNTLFLPLQRSLHRPSLNAGMPYASAHFASMVNYYPLL